MVHEPIPAYRSPSGLASRITQDVYDYCRRRVAEDMRFPTMREIQSACRISSVSVVSYNLEILLKRGLVCKTQCGSTSSYYFPEMRDAVRDLIHAATAAVEGVPADAWDEPSGREVLETLEGAAANAKSVWQIT